MNIARAYSHLGGAEILAVKFPKIKRDIESAIDSVCSPRTKVSKEKGRHGDMLYSPRDLNDAFNKEFSTRGFKELRLPTKIETDSKTISSYKQIDYNRDRVNVEVQMGKYAFMFYDMSKFQHFYNEDMIDVGVEIVPSYEMMRQMSSGVSYGEQLVSDIKRLHRHYPSVPIKIIMIEP